MPNRSLLVAAAILGFFGVALGAFGAHALDLVEPALGRWHTASQYHQLHAVAALLAAILRVPKAGWLFIAGTVVFSGSLYLMALTGTKWLGAITPIGGLCYLVGWAWLAVQAGRATASPEGI